MGPLGSPLTGARTQEKEAAPSPLFTELPTRRIPGNCLAQYYLGGGSLCILLLTSLLLSELLGEEEEGNLSHKEM